MYELQIIGRFFARWVMIYFICFTITLPIELLTVPLQVVPVESQPEWLKTINKPIFTFMGWVMEQKNNAIKYVGEKYFDLKVKIQMTGSGDTRRNYVGAACTVVISLAITMVVSLLLEVLRVWKPHWRLDQKLHAFSRVWVRFFLINMLFGYGFAKAFPNQFPVPVRMYETAFGDLQPMSLLWAFMGHSTPYQMITGGVELLAALLLIPRRTTLLGAMMTILAMTQVFILNMCYDVPVKLYSFHYLMMGLFLAAPALPALFKLFVLGKPSESVYEGPLFANRWLNWLGLLIKLIIFGCLLWIHINSGIKRYEQQHLKPDNPVQGVWDVTAITINGKSPESDEKDVWKKIDLNTRGMVIIHGTTPPAIAYQASFDADKGQIQLQKLRDPSWRAPMKYSQPDPEKLELISTFNDKVIVAKLRKLPAKKYALSTQGFHWFHEFPYDDGK
jgi:hypothetical protein